MSIPKVRIAPERPIVGGWSATVAGTVDGVAGEADEACPVCVTEDFAG